MGSGQETGTSKIVDHRGPALVLSGRPGATEKASEIDCPFHVGTIDHAGEGQFHRAYLRGLNFGRKSDLAASDGAFNGRRRIGGPICPLEHVSVLLDHHRRIVGSSLTCVNRQSPTPSDVGLRHGNQATAQRDEHRDGQ